MRRLLSLLVFCLVSVSALAGETTPLIVETASGPRRFDVEVAATGEEIRRGLMYRESLPATGGMLFTFGDYKPRVFWMRNTLIPLDMLFITSDGTINHIHANAKPQDWTSIFSKGPALAVLEINGGFAKLAGINVGDRVRHAFFGDRIPE